MYTFAVMFSFCRLISSTVPNYEDCQIPIIETPNLYKYILLSDHGIDIGNSVRDSIRFKVKASNDAHLALMSSKTVHDPLYEIVLGGWANSKSVIRDRKQGRALATHYGHVLNQNEYRTFYIKWSNGHIRVENEWNEKIMEWNDTSNPLNITNIGVSTGWGSTGYWSFGCLGIQEQENIIFSKITEIILISLTVILLVIVTLSLRYLFIQCYRRNQMSSPSYTNKVDTVNTIEHYEEINMALEIDIDDGVSQSPENDQFEYHEMRDIEQMSMPASIQTIQEQVEQTMHQNTDTTLGVRHM